MRKMFFFLLLASLVLFLNFNVMGQTNMLSNGNFSSGLSPWYSYVDPTASATVSVSNGVLKAAISNGGLETWMVSLYQGNLRIETGEEYVVTFDAKADGPRTIHAFVGQSAEPYDIYSADNVINLTTTMTTYTYTFTMAAVTDSTAVIEFDFGTDTTDVYIDNVSLAKAVVTPTPMPTATPIIINVALNKPVVASGQFSPEFPPANAVDGNENTAWGSKYNAGPQWLFVDTGKIQKIDEAILSFFDPYYSPHYFIGISNDAKEWTFAAEITDGIGGTRTIPVNSEARYIGIYLTKSAKKVYGVKEFKALSVYIPPTPTPTATPTATVTPTPTAGDKTFVCTAVRDNLDATDYTMMINGLKSLGYESIAEVRDVTVNQMKNFVQQNYTYLYHTGHGNEGSAALADGTYRYTMATVNLQNLTWATCLTLVPVQWMNYMGDTCQTISGYTKNSFDSIDEGVVTTMLNELGNNKTYPVAWYLANYRVSSLDDRWCMYARASGTIVEYSARSGKTPPTVRDEEYVVLDNAPDCKIAASLLADDTKVSSKKRAVVGHTRANDDVALSSFDELPAAGVLTKDEAVAAVEAYLAVNGGLPADAVLDDVIALSVDKDLVLGYTVKYARVIDGLKVCANGIADQITFLVDSQKNVVFKTDYWPAYTTLSDDATEQVLTIAEAVTLAAAEISRAYKGTDCTLVAAKPVYGSVDNSLVPAYIVTTDDGAEIVIDATNGKIVK